MNVSIVIVNYNTRELLANCLLSVYEQTKDVTFEVIVVDNASTDGSKEYVTARFPDVRWIASPVNLGFGKANNLGAKEAQGEYLLLLNSDTLLRNNAVRMFYDYAERHKAKNMVLGGWLLTTDGDVNKSYGDFPTIGNEVRYLCGKVKCALRRKAAKEQPTQKDVDYVIGADLFVSRKLFNRFGGFDPNIFMYYEETDLQLRMAKAGIRRRVIVGPEIVHLEGGSFAGKGLTVSRFRMAQTSYNYLVRKHHKGLGYAGYKITLGIIRLTVLFQRGWTLKERLSAYRLVWER